MRPRSLSLALATLLLGACARRPAGRVVAGGPEASAIDYARIARYPEPGGRLPRAIAFSPDGRILTYLMSEDDSPRLALFAADTTSGARRVFVRGADLTPGTAGLSREEELRRERQRQRAEGVTAYAWAKNAARMVIPFGGDVFVREADGAIRRLTSTPEPEIDPQICDTGERIAFVRGRELFVADVATGRERALSAGAPDGVTRGLADFNAQEEFDETSGFAWAPDCRRIALLEVDERGVATTPVLGFRSGGADLMMQRYPLAGGPNPVVRLGVVDVETGRTIWTRAPDGTDGYWLRLEWAPDGRALFAQRLRRDQRRLTLVRVDPRTAAATEVLVESSDTWVDPAKMWPLELERSDRFLWTSVVSGRRHLGLYEASGRRVAQLTNGDWDVAGVAAVDEEQGVVYVNANRDGPIEQHLYAVPLAGGEPRRLSREKGTHAVTCARSGRICVDVHSAGDRFPTAVLREVEGRDVAVLEVARDADLDRLRLRAPEIVTVRGPGGQDLHGALLRPRRIEAGRRHPAVVMVYGGPSSRAVADVWQPRLLWQHLADRGFVVFEIDNRGTAGRGRAFETASHRRLGQVELADQLAGIEYLRSLPFVDPARIGIYGRSYGGFMAALVLMSAPDRVRAGVAGSPVTRWDLYDTAYTERYMDTPERNAEGYRWADLGRLAPALTGKLLLVHGLMDENVHFENTAHLIDTFIRADKTFDLLVLPGERHGVRDPRVRTYVTRRIVEYLVENL